MFDIALTPQVILWVGLLLAFKHFVADGPLQTAYQYLNKGNLFHPGGYLHAGIHGLATAIVFFPFGLAWFGLVDFFVHYCIDYSKTNLTKTFGWSGMAKAEDGRVCLQIYSDWYFYALVLDQCLHFATYLVLLYGLTIS